MAQKNFPSSDREVQTKKSRRQGKSQSLSSERSTKRELDQERKELGNLLDHLGINELRLARQYIAQFRVSDLLRQGFETLVLAPDDESIYAALIAAVSQLTREMGLPVDQSSFVVFERGIGTIKAQYPNKGDKSDVGRTIFRTEGSVVNEMYRRMEEKEADPYLVIDDVTAPEAKTLVPDSVDILTRNDPPIMSIAVFPVFRENTLVGTFGIDYFNKIQLSANKQLLDFCYTLANFAGIVLELRENEAEKRAANALALFGDVASNIAHYMNGKLSAMGLRVTDIKDSDNKDEINRLADALLRDIKDGLKYIRGISTQMDRLLASPTLTTPENVQDIVRRVQDSLESKLKSRDDVDLKVVAPKQNIILPFPFLDRTLELLLLNAIDSTENSKQGKVQLTVSRKRDEVEFSVSDNGPGIPEHVRAHVLEFGASTKSEGLGWGLWMAQQQLRRYGSKLEFSSGPNGSGTTFTFVLPIEG